MEKVKKCKIDFKESKGKLIMSQRGYCDEKNPNKLTNRDVEVNIEGMGKAMDKVISNFD